MDYYKPNIPETEAVVGIDSAHCTIFFLVTTHILSLVSTSGGSLSLPTSVSCLTHSTYLSPFCAFFPLHDHDLRTEGWRMAG